MRNDSSPSNVQGEVREQRDGRVLPEGNAERGNEGDGLYSRKTMEADNGAPRTKEQRYEWKRKTTMNERMFLESNVRRHPRETDWYNDQESTNGREQSIKNSDGN